MTSRIALVCVLSLLSAEALAANKLGASVLPTGRAVLVNKTATAIATVVNDTGVAGSGCGVDLLSTAPVAFSYQALNDDGSAHARRNKPVAIGIAESRKFKLSFKSTIALDPIELRLRFDCQNVRPAAIISGINTFLFSASTSRTPDVWPVASTVSGDGITNIPGVVPAAVGVMSIAAVNKGARGRIRVVPAVTSRTAPVALTICRTNPDTATCMGAASPTLRLRMGPNTQFHFAVFARASAPVPLNIIRTRIRVTFKDDGNEARGFASTAVRTQDIMGPDGDANGVWDDVDDQLADFITDQTARQVATDELLAPMQEQLLFADLNDISQDNAERLLRLTECVRFRQGDLIADQARDGGEVTLIATKDRLLALLRSDVKRSGSHMMLSTEAALQERCQ